MSSKTTDMNIQTTSVHTLIGLLLKQMLEAGDDTAVFEASFKLSGETYTFCGALTRGDK